MEPKDSLPHSEVPARSIQYMPAHPTSWRSVLILFSHLCLGLPSGFLPSAYPTKTLYKPLLWCSAHLILLDLITRTIWWGAQIIHPLRLCWRKLEGVNVRGFLNFNQTWRGQRQKFTFAEAGPTNERWQLRRTFSYLNSVMLIILTPKIVNFCV
jgi:hypothetical protein